MKFDDSGKKTLSEYLAQPPENRSVRGLSSLFWSTLESAVSTCARGSGDLQELVTREMLFVNYGIVPEIMTQGTVVGAKIQGSLPPYRHLVIERMADWLLTTMATIQENDKKEQVEKELQFTRLQLSRLTKEQEGIEQTREDVLAEELGGSDRATITFIQTLADMDALNLDILRSRRAVSRGAFMSVPQRRELVSKESRLKEEITRLDGLISHLSNDQKKAELRQLCHSVPELLGKVLDVEDVITKLEKEIVEIQDKQQALSPLEVDARITKEIDYIKDLITLAAKRLKGESCPFLRPQDTVFTYDSLCACFEHIQQFDPRIFKNDRVNIVGKPSVLIAPGNGNALYDWKNNRIIVPIVPPAGNFMASIATAIIEYRLDVDDEKNMVNSYSKLPHLKGVKSIIQIKSSLVKDYLIWMGQEARGYKILPKETRMWFEHEIAPNKSEICCPPHLQSFVFSSEEFKTKLIEADEKIGTAIDTCDPALLWEGALLNYHQGKYERSFECLKSYTLKCVTDAFGFYNLGMTALKVTRKQDASIALQEFCKLMPQSWWTTVAREHLQRLQIG